MSTSPIAPARPFSWVMRGRCWRLGHDVPHMGGVVPMRIVSEMWHDPQAIVPHLFEETDPGFHERCRPGDIIVAGRHFGMGPKMQGYLAMHALGLGLVCESMSFLAWREAIGIGLPVLTDCADATAACDTGDELEVDFRQGLFRNLTRGTERAFKGIPPALHDVVEAGGTTGWLKAWWARQASAAVASHTPETTRQES